MVRDREEDSRADRPPTPTPGGCASGLTCSLVLKVVFDMVGLQAVHIRASFGGTIVKVVVDHVVNHVAAQPPDKDANPHDVRQRVAEDNVERAHH